MGDVYEAIRQSLDLATRSYRAVESGGGLSPQNWMENVRLLKPIIDRLQQEAQTSEARCRRELDQQNDAYGRLLADRARRYSEVEAEKARLSEVGAAIIGLTAQISKIDSEIAQKRKQVEENQEKLRQSKEKQKDWNTAFWCTFWIPFANIGMAVKKADVDNEYAAKAKVLGGEIKRLQADAAALNDELARLRAREREKSETSAALTRTITTIEGRISQVTAEINSLGDQINLWRSILQVCQDANTRLGHADGDLAAVRKCFDALLKVEEMLRAPATTRFVEGRTCRGACLRAGESLGRGEYLVSPNRKFVALLSRANELVVCNSKGKLWSSGTQGAKGEGRLRLDGRGPAALTGVDRAWTSKRPGAVSLAMQDDGNLVAYGADGQSLWASDTFTYANVDSRRFQTQAK